MLNLFETDIHTSPIFSVLPRFSKVDFEGFLTDGIQFYRAEREGEKCSVLGMTLIRRDEKIVWEAVDDLLGRSVKDAAPLVRGVYRFDLLSFDVHREVNIFNFQDLTQLIVNHSRKLAVGGEELIKYCSCYGILKRLSDQTWGKTNFLPHVEVFAKPVEQLDLLIKRVLKAAWDRPRPAAIVINDQSQTPVYDFHNESQRQRLLKNTAAQLREFDIPPEIYVRDNRGVTELSGKLIHDFSA